MFKFYKNLAFIVMPFIALWLLELFVFPRTAFTYRVWEAGRFIAPSAYSFPWIPNQHYKMNQRGDLDYFKWSAQSRPVEWYTDQFGFRNPPPVRGDETFDFVLIGDSLITGANLTEDDTIRAQTARECKCTAYSYAASGAAELRAYLNDPRFLKYPPRNVVFELREGDLYYIAPGNAYNAESRFPAFDSPGYEWKGGHLTYWQSIYEHGRKFLMLHYFNAFSDRAWNTQNTVYSDKMQHGVASKMEPEDDLIVRRATEYKTRLAERGSHFIFLITPSVEPVVFRVIEKLHAANVDVVHYSEKPDFKPQNTYDVNDSHWTSATVTIYAKKLADIYRREQKIGALGR